MWFLPFSVRLGRNGLLIPGHEIWFLRLVQRLLAADAPRLRLLRHVPFGVQRPAFIRAPYYRYRFTTSAEKRTTGACWSRELIGGYLLPVSLARLT